ncbi:MAG: mechanosensitive ion channel family protein [Chloroflexia bacterium]|nr:mechanosensitive ion channel family protein [Chloroflexia bacterium]
MSIVGHAIDSMGIDPGAILRSLALVVLIAIAARYVGRWLRRRVERSLSVRSFGRNGAILLGRLTSLAIYVAASIAILASLGVSGTGLLTFLGAGTVALGLSLQDVLKNFFSGVFLLMERPFRVGDFIRIRDVEGEVQGIDVRTTLVRINDGSLVMIPNSLVFTEILTNRSKSGTRRIDLVVVAEGRSILEAERLIHETLRSMPEVSRPIAAPVVTAASSAQTIFSLSVLVDDSRDAEQRVIHALVSAVDDESITISRP